MSAAEQLEMIAMLRDSARGLLAAHDGRAAALRAAGGFDPAMWRRFAEQGWLAARLPEALGGLGLGVPELAGIAFEMGMAGASDPLALGAFQPAALLAGSDPQTAGPLAERLDDGPLAAALSPWAVEPDAGGAYRFDALHHGEVVLVAVAASTGTELRAVPRTALDFASERELPNGARRQTLVLSANSAAEAPLLAAGDAAGAAWMAARVEAGLLIAAQLGGASRALFEITAAHCRDRVQFGKPLAEFQVLRHRIADLAIALELADASLAAAMRDTASYHPAMARAAETALTLAKAAIQLHGAIGFTEESRIAPYVRMAMTLGPLLGTPSYHRSIAWQRFREGRRDAA